MGSRHCGRWVVAAALFAALGTSLSGAPSAKGERPSAPNAAVRAAPGEIIVGFKRGLSSRRRAAALDRARAAPAARLPEIGAVLATVPAGEVRAALAKLRGERGVRYAEANFTLYASGHGASPNDPSFHELWGLDNFGQPVNGFPGTAGDDVGALEAWQVTTGSADVTVGIIDTGVDWSHPDLAANVWRNPGESCAGCANDGVDNDGNGYVDDVRGWDFVNDDANPSDDHGHGTHVAGTVGAVGDNAVGVAGVNWAVRLMPLKFLGADGSGTTADAIRALLYAVDNGASVTNNSYGGDGFSQAFADALAYADAHDSLFVAAAGNSLANIDTSPTYPASYALPNVITVAATDSSDRRAWFSNYGRKSVDLGAPGDNIYSTWPGAEYEYASGTSVAAPHVAGAAALAKAAFPSASDLGLKTLLLSTVDANASLSGQTVTGGRLNVGSAVQCVATPHVSLEAPASGFVAALGQPVTVSAMAAGCGDPTAVSVSATANGEPIDLAARGDGLFTGVFVPDSEGPLLVTVSATTGGSTATRSVSGVVPITIVPDGDPVTVTIADSGGDALLAFTGTAEQRVSLRISDVTMGTSTCCSARVSIGKPDGTTLVTPTYVGTNGGFIDTRTLPAAGTYTILVDPQSAATGAVTLTLYDVPPDASATIAPGAPAVSVMTSMPGQNARVVFTGTAGQRVSLRLTGVTIGTSTCCSARASITNPDGTTLTAPTYVGTNGGFLDTRTLPVSGTYSILVDPQEMATGSATLTLYNVPPDAGATISPGGPAVTVTTSVPGQNARATFAGTSGQRISLKVGPSCCQTRVSVLKPDGSALVSPTYMTTSTGFIDTRTLPVSGTYTILVDPQELATGSATLTLYDVPPDASATLAPGGPAVTVTTSVPGQNARVTFVGAAGQSITLKSSGVTIPVSKVSVAKPDGTALIAPTYVFTSGKTLTAQLPVAGTYVITVDPDAANVGSMTLTLS